MPTIILKLEDSLYRELERRARAEGFPTVVDYVRHLIYRSLGYVHEEPSEKTSTYHSATPTHGDEHKRVSGVVEKLLAVLERRLQDRINPFTQKVDDLNRRLAEVIERIEMLEEKIKALESHTREATYTQTAAQREERRETRRRSAIEILREQKAIFESDIARRIKDRDSFFLKLQREGAKIIEAKGERIALDPDFWNEFLSKLSSISTNNEEEVLSLLDDPIERRLFEKLREAALIYYDAVAKRWVSLVE